MAFWSGETIKACGAAIIRPFNVDQIDCNSYTLKMGCEYYRTSDDGKKLRAGRLGTKVRLEDGEPFVIPAGQFAFLLTHEEVEIPTSVMAFISIKSTYKFQGLVNISGFHVDPGYRGKLIFSVFNAGPSPIHLAQGSDLFLIWFADLDRNSEEVKRDNGKDEIPNNLIKGMNREVLSLQKLSEELSNIKFSMRVLRALFAWGVGIATALVVAIVSISAKTLLDLNSLLSKLLSGP